MIQNRYKIYILIDPRTNKVKHVGLTKRPIEVRLNEHIKNNYKILLYNYQYLCLLLNKYFNFK